AQWLSEWGAPITLLWLAVAARALYDAARGSESLARKGALIALFGLVLQNLVDLGFEVLGMAVVAAALFAAIVASARAEPNPVSTPRSLHVPTFLVLGGAIAALLLLAPHIGAQSVSELDAKLRQQMHADDRPGFRATLREAMQLHPGEPQLAVIAATEALRHDDRSTAKWINHVMKLAPKWGAPHALAFQWLWSKGRRQQALLELRAAAEIDPRPWQPLTCSVARVSGNWVVAAAPSGAERQRYLELATMCIEPTHRSAAVIDETLMAEFPKRPIGFQRAAFRVAESGRVDEGLGMLAALLRRNPEDHRSRVGRAYILLRAQRWREAIQFIEQDLPLIPEDQRRGMLQFQGSAYAALKDEAGVKRTVERYRRLMVGTAAGFSDSYALEARLQQELDHPGSALAAFREAYRINPETRYLAEIAVLAGRLGNHAQRLWAYVELCAREPVGTTYCAVRDQLLKTQPAGTESSATN
ncbi:MAG TPA: hypothetical protein VJR89_04015, partial [Polyangiales bacterium]|nr:hypothetical protein [Polyangiales bacterium]